MLGRILHWGLTGEWLKLPKICEYNDKRWSKTLSFGNFVVFDIISYPLGGVMEYHTNMRENGYDRVWDCGKLRFLWSNE